MDDITILVAHVLPVQGQQLSSGAGAAAGSSQPLSEMLGQQRGNTDLCSTEEVFWGSAGETRAHFKLEKANLKLLLHTWQRESLRP